MRTFYRALRSISAVTLFFFVWSFLPLWQAVAYAAEEQGTRGQGPGSSVQGAAAGMRNGKAETATAGDRFEKALDGIRENVVKARDKEDRGEDDTRERDAIKAKRAEIESADGEFKKEFSATEKKLKDAKLPKEILDRHYKFVKHYEDNLKELRANLDGVDQAKTRSDRRAKVEKVRLHLAKVKAPSKHQKLDPNNLPFRARKAGKTREPRLKLDEFERDFHSKKKTRTAFNPKDLLAADSRRSTQILVSGFKSAVYNKPILVASNGSLAGILSSNNQFPRTAGNNLPLPSVGEGWGEGAIPNSAFAISQWDTPNSELGTQNYQLAQATGQPAAEDLAETPDVQFTDAIRAKAQELGGKPLKIYEWVRNNIEYAPTYGSIQGADQCLQSKICNDMDTASLLIALLRVSGVYSHYEYSTIEIPIEQAMNWVGGVTDPKMVGTILATNGIPAKMLISGGAYKAVQLEHVYVSAFIDYIPSRGAVHRQGDTWIPLDASYKQYTYTQGIDIAAAVPFDAQTFVNQIQSTATINPDGSVTNVNSALVQQAMQDYQSQVQNYIQQNPNIKVGDFVGKKGIVQQNYPILLGTLPYKTVQLGSEFTMVPENLRETMSFVIADLTGASVGLTYTISMPQIAGKKITLSFSPATANDQAIIESLLPASHTDGSPIQTKELPLSFPAYLINLKPELRIDGQVVASGASATMGSAQPFVMSLNEPGFGLSNIDNIIKVGEYFGIGLDAGGIGAGNLNNISSKLAATQTKLNAKVFTNLTKDDLIGDLLHRTIINYFAELDVNDEVEAKVVNVIRYRATSIGMCSLEINVKELFGAPLSINYKGMMMDVDRIMQGVFSKDENMDGVKRYMLSSGNRSSMLEHMVPEELYSTPTNTVNGISAVKALQIANDSGMPLFSIDQSNSNEILPQLQIGADVKTDIANAISAGKVVTVSKTYVTYNGSSICGYIIIDPNTNAGAYMISSGAAGALIPNSLPQAGLLILATIGLILSCIATEAAAEELEPTYYFTSAPSCVGPAYLHTGEYVECVGNAFSNNLGDIAKMLSWGLLGLAYKKNPLLGLSLAIVSAISIEIWAINTAKQCREDAIHCDLKSQ